MYKPILVKEVRGDAMPYQFNSGSEYSADILFNTSPFAFTPFVYNVSP